MQQLHTAPASVLKNLRGLQSQLREISNEIKYYDLETDVFHAYINGNSIASHQGWDDVRIIFWYDN